MHIRGTSGLSHSLLSLSPSRDPARRSPAPRHAVTAIRVSPPETLSHTSTPSSHSTSPSSAASALRPHVPRSHLPTCRLSLGAMPHLIARPPPMRTSRSPWKMSQAARAGRDGVHARPALEGRRHSRRHSQPPSLSSPWPLGSCCPAHRPCAPAHRRPLSCGARPS